MPRTSAYVISLLIISYVIVTSLLPEVGGSSRKCWYGRETTWKGDDAATYKYVIPGDIQLGVILVCDIRGHTVLRVIPGDIQLGVILSIQQYDERRPCGNNLRDTGVVQLVEAVVYAIRFAPHLVPAHQHTYSSIIPLYCRRNFSTWNSRTGTLWYILTVTTETMLSFYQTVQ